MSFRKRFIDLKAATQRYLVPRPSLRLFLMSVLVVFAAFPDVLLTGASISMLDKFRVPLQGREHRSFYPEKSNTLPEDGFYDSDGAALQSEPAIQFVADAIYSLQSPYWNPYSGAGSVGPETMVDIKFSPISILVALLGGSNLAFHFVSLLAFSFTLFFLGLVCTRLLGLSRDGSLAVCIAYLLNGYATANLSSNTNQVYFYFPFALYAVMNFSRNPDVRNYLFLVVAYLVPLLVTFFPTTVLMITTVAVLAVASVIQAESSMKARVRLVMVHSTAPLFAVALLAFLYLPLLETLKFTGAVENYALRPFYTANWLSILSLFSAKTFFESYSSVDPKYTPLITNVVFHFGIVVGIIAALAAFSRRVLQDAVLAAAVGLFAISLGRIFGLPGLSHLIDQVPFFRNLGEQYWWMMVACCFSIVFAYGVLLIEKNIFRYWPAVFVSGTFVASVVYVWHLYGFPSLGDGSPISTTRAAYYVFRALLTVCATLFGLYAFNRWPLSRSKIMMCLVLVVFIELLFYANSTRVTRTDVFRDPPDYVQFLKKNLGLQRVANYGAHGLPAEVGSGFQIQQIEFFTMNLVPAYSELCQRGITNQHGWQGQGFCANRDPQIEPNINPALLDMLSVRYIVVTRYMPKFIKYFIDHKYPRAFETTNIIIFENRSAFPRAYGVDRLVEARQTPETKDLSATNVAFTDDAGFMAVARARGVDVPTLSGLRREPDRMPAINFERVQILDYKNTRVRIAADFAKAGVLVLPDNWHPNWRATVDGSPGYVGRVNQTFRGIALAAGPHIVEFHYRPKTLSLGLLISGITIVLLALVFVFRRAIEFHLRTKNSS